MAGWTRKINRRGTERMVMMMRSLLVFWVWRLAF